MDSYTPRILILEDDVLTALDIKMLIEAEIEADITVCASLETARGEIERGFDFAFLDIELIDGDSFEIAGKLREALKPFAFVSGAGHDRLPPELKDSTLVPKPYSAQMLLTALRGALLADGKGT